jgi:HEAT repeat protein
MRLQALVGRTLLLVGLGGLPQAGIAATPADARPERTTVPAPSAAQGSTTPAPPMRPAWEAAAPGNSGIARPTLPAAARPARAAPTPAGSAIQVTATADGGLELHAGKNVAHVAVATPALRRGTVSVRELQVDGHRIAELRIPVRGHPSEEVWIGDIGAHPPRTIWTGLTGPRDADEETATVVEATPERIFEYQTAAQVTRCDGEPVRLFTRAWDFASARFRPILSTPPAAATQNLTARRADPAMPSTRSIGGFHFTAASTTAAAGADARALAAPTALDDGNPKTIWAEGLGGDGRGEFLTARASAGHYAVRGIRIVPGDASTAATFKAKNRLKSIALTFGPEPEKRFDVAFPEDPAAGPGMNAPSYWIALPAPVDSACVTVVIRDVYRGTETGPAGGGGTTAISDLEIFTELDQASGVERLVADMAAGVDCQSRIPLLVALGDGAVLPAAQTVLGASGVGRECLVEALSRMDGTVKSGVALDALASALVGASAHEEQLIAQTLRKAPSPPVHAIAKILQSPSAKTAPDDRARAARLLGALAAPDAGAALLAAAGGDNSDVRLAIVQALGTSPQVSVAQIVATIDKTAASGAPGTPGSANRQADLLRALPALGRRTEADRTLAVQSLRRALASSRSFEVQARSVLGLGAIGDATSAKDLIGVREKSDDAVLRFLATRELGTLGGPTALQALRAALDDADPRVRETAAQGLGARHDKFSEAVLIAAAKEEPWPFARRAQLEALSRTCGAPARELLMRAMERDVDEVRRAALVGLVRCQDDRARATLLSTLKARRASATLRELAAALLGELGDRTVAKDLADLMGALVNEGEGDLAIEAVAGTALRSLGHLGGPDAALATAQLAQDTHHPYRHLAIELLGDICDPAVGAAVLTKLRTDTDATTATAAQSAEQRCRSAAAPGIKPVP